MSFKTKPSTYRIDLAPTHRARCRACKRHVPKDAVRIVTLAFVRPQRATSFVRCAPECMCVSTMHSPLPCWASMVALSESLCIPVSLHTKPSECVPLCEAAKQTFPSPMQRAINHRKRTVHSALQGFKCPSSHLRDYKRRILRAGL